MELGLSLLLPETEEFLGATTRVDCSVGRAVKQVFRANPKAVCIAMEERESKLVFTEKGSAI